MILPKGSNILDLDQDSADARKVIGNWGGTRDDFYDEDWTDKSKVLPFIKKLGYDGAKFGEEYILSKDLIKNLDISDKVSGKVPKPGAIDVDAFKQDLAKQASDIQKRTMDNNYLTVVSSNEYRPEQHGSNGFIMPNGKIVSSDDHDYLAKRIDNDTNLNELVNMGFVRFEKAGNNFDLELQRQPTPKQIKAIEALKGRGLDIYYDILVPNYETGDAKMYSGNTKAGNALMRFIKDSFANPKLAESAHKAMQGVKGKIPKPKL